MMTRPASIQLGMLTWIPMTALSYCPGPSMLSTAMPRDSQRSPYIATLASLKLSMPGMETTAGMRSPL